MTSLSDLNDSALAALHRQASEDYQRFKALGLCFNMARGKPAAEQLALSDRLLALPGRGQYRADDDTDVRNYGAQRSLPEAQALLAHLVGAAPEDTLVEGNSSLALMHDHLVFSLLKGNPDSPQPWCREPTVRFICPVPGYDYHFNMTAEYGIDMIPVALHDDGPDMDAVEALVADDASIKGMWCMPKYSNPTGAVYSDAVIERLARMPTAAPDFRLFWDNAYAVHHVTTERVEIADILQACEAAGHGNRALVFASTSKITFAGAGLAAFTSSEANRRWFVDKTSKRSIVPDRINQLRHTALLPNVSALHALMDDHQQIVAPKFDAVHSAFEHWLDEPRLAEWSRPRGGYFISVRTPAGCAQRTVALAAAAGIEMTPAGAAFPYGHDPQDNHLRIAPTFLSLKDVEQAAQGIALAIRLAASEQCQAERGL